LARRVPGATRAAPADPERREPPELTEEVRQRIQAVVSAAHAQAARELEAQHEGEAPRGQLQRDQRVRRKRSGKAPRRAPDAVNGATSPEEMPPSKPQRRPEHWSGVDAEFDTAPLPRLTASGAIASPEVNHATPPLAGTAAPNGAVKPDLADKQRHAARQEQEGGAQHKRTARQTRIAQRELTAQQQRAAARQEQERAAQERARQEQERAAQERARLEQERAAKELARKEEERAAQERARQEQERAAQERARQEQERAAQERAAEEHTRKEAERAAQERARQEQESLARQEQKRTARQERTSQRERAAERKRAAKEERERAAQELVEQKRVAQERSRQEQERAAEELARQLEELAAQERIRQEQELEDREWAAQKRARLEREREEAEELVRREQGTAEHNGAEHNGAVPPVPLQSTPARPAAARVPAQSQPRGPEVAGSRRYRTSALIAAVIVLIGAGSLAIARSLHASGHGSAHAPGGAAAAAMATRNEAAAWVAQQVSHSAVISCDRTMCLALRAHGVFPNDLFVLDSKAANPYNYQIIVATAAVRNLLGSRLVSAAPAVLASFGSGNARVEIRQIERNGAAGYESALKTDLQLREDFERTALLNSLQIQTSASARKQLAAGLVDARLGLLIENLAVWLPRPVDIVAFGDPGPGASAGIPLRSATLAGSMATLRSTLRLARSKAEYPPTHAEITKLGGRNVLIVEFAAPVLLGVLNPGSRSNP